MSAKVAVFLTDNGELGYFDVMQIMYGYFILKLNKGTGWDVILGGKWRGTFGEESETL